MASGVFSPFKIVPDPVTNPKFMTVHNFEYCDLNKWRLWFFENWSLSLYFAAFYLVLIFGLQHIMKTRQPFNLRKYLAWWNTILCLFSTVGFIRMIPEVLHVISTSKDGIHNSICSREGHSATTAFWILLMTWSKLLELGDTVFIVLRKQKLILLHWYHHVSVLVTCWFTYSNYEPAIRWFTLMNYGVHSLMYFYYALVATRIKVPRAFAFLITSLQMLQMMAGVLITLYSLIVTRSGEKCIDGLPEVYATLLIYATYFILFLNFFRQAYVNEKPKAKKHN